MSDIKWRENLNLIVEESLNEILRETKEHSSAIKKSQDPAKAQIWVAIALLNKKLKDQEIENKKYKSKIPKKELDKILKTLEQM